MNRDRIVQSRSFLYRFSKIELIFCKFFKIMIGIERQKKCLLLGNESPKELISDMLYIDMEVYSDMDLLSRSAGVGSA